MRGEAGQKPVLVVDLDSSLLCSDMLFESFWAGFARDWRQTVGALFTVFWGGRAALKAALADGDVPDPALLPYNQAVLAQIDSWHAAGGRVELVSASDQRLAAAVAGHLGVFDAVHGSDGQSNLKGAAKAAFLIGRFGHRGYVYLGDSTADLPVWAAAADAITVGAGPRLRRRVVQIHPQARHLPAGHQGWRAALLALRPHQWLKNLLIFLPILAAHALDPAVLLQGAQAFVAFGLVASSVYLLNDLLDLAADRAHPRKRARPLASGGLPLARGMVMAPLLLLAGLLVALALPPAFLAVLMGYYVLTLTYSLWLKRKILIDIFTLAALYALRVVAGAAAAGIGLSVWLVAFSVFLFLALAAVKRQGELVDMAERGLEAASGRGYGVRDLPMVAQMATASGFMAVLVLMLYLDTPEVQARYATPELLWGACLVLLYWLARMVAAAYRGRMHDDPIVFAAQDRGSLVALGLIMALVAGAALL